MDEISIPEISTNPPLKYIFFPASSSPLSKSLVSKFLDKILQIEEDIKEDKIKKEIDGEREINDKIKDISTCGGKIERKYYHIRRKL